MSGPTKGAGEGVARSWAASPKTAFAVRVAIFVTPLIVAWLVLQAIGPWLIRPEIRFGTLIWIVQGAAISAVAAIAVDRVMVRFLPLATLMGFSLTFPDRAPSRFGVALKSGSMKQLEKRIDELRRDGLSRDVDQAAREAMELVTMLSRHDRLTRGHTERVRAFSDLIAVEMGLNDDQRNKLAWGALLHDIGKITVPSAILNKDGRPTDDEWRILQNHPAAGEAFVEPLAAWLGEFRLATSQHHEKWDGSGYPRGLEGTEISLAGRIVAVADAYDVITSKRSYKSPMSVEAARAEMVRCSGGQFDPAVVRALLSASMGKRRNAGPLAWLLELPAIARTATTVASIPAAAVVTAAVATGALTTPSTTLKPVDALSFPESEITITTQAVDVGPTTTTDQSIGSTSTPSNGAAPEVTDAAAPTTSVPASTSSTEPGETTTTEAGPVTSMPSTPPPNLPTSLPEMTLPPTTMPPTAVPPTTMPPTTVPPTTVPPTTLPPTTLATTTSQATTTTTQPKIPVTARDDAASVLIVGSVLIDVLDNDIEGSGPIDPNTLSIVDQPLNGSVEIEGDEIRYRPATVLGADRFVYEICDSNGLCDSAEVTVTVLSLF